MKKNRRVKLNRPARLRRVDKSLAAYGLALGAAAAAGTDTAEASPIYFDVPDMTLTGGVGNINLNLSNLINPATNLPDAVINYSTPNTNTIAANNLNLQFNSLNNSAEALNNPVNFNSEIGPNLINSTNNPFSRNFNLATSNPDGGNFFNTNAFLGIRLDIPGGSPHFGWVGLNVNPNLDVTVYDFAIESSANTSIRAGATAVPEPGTLTLLALGSAGLAAWRKRRERR